MHGHERAEHGSADGGRDDHGAARPAAAVDERPEQRRHDGEREQREEQVQQHLVIGRVGRDGEEERARQRDRDQRVAAEHGALHQREPADRIGLVEQVLLGLLGHVLELLDLGGHRHQANVRCAVTVRAYVLIQTDVGKAAQVAQQVAGIEGVIVADGVTGPYDVIARAEAPSMDDLGRMVVRDVQQIEGITRTITCPVVTI